MKKVLAFIVVIALLIGCCLAEDLSEHPTDPYRKKIEDTLRRATALRAKSAPKFNITITPESEIGFTNPAEWNVDVTGGTAPYRYTYIVGSIPESGYVWDPEGAMVDTESNTFCYQFIVPNTYCLFVTVTDSTGYSEQTYTEPFEIPADEKHPPLDDFVTQIAEQCKAEASGDFDRAVWLHDYLTHNACYDRGYNYYGPDGVLLRHTGVCDSYRKAYTKLLRKIGIEAGGVTGGDHAWVMAKLDGDWYMIDPTWDDPLTRNNVPLSGEEHHLYFGLTTELMGLDHIIEDYVDVPSIECTAIADNYAYHTKEAKQWMEDDTLHVTNIRKQIEQSMDAGGLYYPLEKTPVQLYHNGDYYIEDRNALVWAPITWAIADETWTVDGVSMPVRAEYDTDTYALKAELDLARMDAIHQPQRLTTIEEGAYANDASIGYVVIPKGTETIGSKAFADCKALMCVEIPESVTQIADDAFDGCNRVTILPAED